MLILFIKVEFRFLYQKMLYICLIYIAYFKNIELLEILTRKILNVLH